MADNSRLISYNSCSSIWQALTSESHLPPRIAYTIENNLRILDEIFNEQVDKIERTRNPTTNIRRWHQPMQFFQSAGNTYIDLDEMTT
nr:5961_t:CDS:2 [Entrophospora candida]